MAKDRVIVAKDGTEREIVSDDKFYRPMKPVHPTGLTDDTPSPWSMSPAEKGYHRPEERVPPVEKESDDPIVKWYMRIENFLVDLLGDKLDGFIQYMSDRGKK